MKKLLYNNKKMGQVGAVCDTILASSLLLSPPSLGALSFVDEHKGNKPATCTSFPWKSLCSVHTNCLEDSSSLLFNNFFVLILLVGAAPL
jgi:hypothetical protein